MGAPALHKALSNLIRKDLVRRGQDKEYFIIDNFLAEWIKEVLRIESTLNEGKTAQGAGGAAKEMMCFLPLYPFLLKGVLGKNPLARTVLMKDKDSLGQ